MSLTFGFYNSINGDRVYDAIQVSQIFDGIITDGVYATFMKGMVVKASSNASEVIVQPGRCWFNHTWTYIDADYPVEAPAPEVILDRVDALVIDINQENAFRENKLTWVQGTPASINPARPTLINTVTHHQYPLAYIYRKAGTTMIYAADITNAVGTSECPFVTGVLEGLDIDAWLAQWDDEFHTWENTTKTQFEGWMVNQQAVYNTWFNAIKDQMEGDLDEFEDWFETIQGIIDSEAATHLQQEIDDLNDRLPAGSFIEITTTESQLFNRNVTVSDGIHSKTVQFDAYGNATVESFPYVGLLTITSTDGIRTATESLSTPYYARYNVTLAFWSATVNLVGDSSATAGIVVSVYDSESAIPLTSITLDSQGRGSYTATYPDTYKFRYSYGGQTMEVSLAVTQETTYTVEIHAGFNYQAWLTAGRVSGTFASLDAILANEAALRQLMLVHDSVDYLADQMVNADVTKIFNNNLAAKWINLSDYALDKFYSVGAIKTVMDTADKYGYGEWALMPQVPKMTSNTAPYGEAIGGANTFFDNYRAFNGNDSENWAAGANTDTGLNGVYIGYSFTSSVCIKEVKYTTTMSGTSPDYEVLTYKVQASNDKSTWKDIPCVDNAVDHVHTGTLTNTDEYLHYRVVPLTTSTSSNGQVAANRYAAIAELQFYAWSPKGNVPVMTSNTAPYGEASASSVYQTNGAYYAFDGSLTSVWHSTAGATQWIQYKSTNPICVKKIKCYSNTTPGPKTSKLQGSNTGDANDWHDIGDFVNCSAAATEYSKTYDNENYYLYHRLYITESNYISGGNQYSVISSLQFYGRELSVSVPKMDTNTTPYGEAFSSSNAVSEGLPYLAFNKVYDNAYWSPTRTQAGTIGSYIGYDFGKPTKVNLVDIAFYTGWGVTSFKIQGTNNISGEWTDIYSESGVTADRIIKAFTNDNAYRYYALRILGAKQSYEVDVVELQFYGLDYSEKEFEVGTTKKWLYDHGVELETIDALSSDNNVNNYVTKKDDELYIHKQGSNSGAAAITNTAINLTSFSLIRARCGDELTTMRISVRSAKSVNDNVDVAVISIDSAVNTNLPNNLSLDVSAVNQSGYPTIGIYQGGTSDVVYMTVKEFWLE